MKDCNGSSSKASGPCSKCHTEVDGGLHAPTTAYGFYCAACCPVCNRQDQTGKQPEVQAKRTAPVKRPGLRRVAIQDDLQVLTEILREGKATESKPRTAKASVHLPPVRDLLKSSSPAPTPGAQRSTPEPTLPPGQAYNPFDYEAQHGVSPVPWAALEDSWLGHGLKRSIEENRPDVVKTLLRILLTRIRVRRSPKDKDVLARVFLPFPGSGGGRPVSIERDSIYRTWEQIGRPSLNMYTLAAKFYGTTFKRADGPKRKRLRDKCRTAVTRARQAELAKTASNSNAKDLFPSVD
jgi:hypothetical protein